MSSLDSSNPDSDRPASPAAVALANLVTVRELATILRMKEPALRAAVASGAIPHMRLGRARIRFDLNQVLATFRSSASPTNTGEA